MEAYHCYSTLSKEKREVVWEAHIPQVPVCVVMDVLVLPGLLFILLLCFDSAATGAPGATAEFPDISGGLEELLRRVDRVDSDLSGIARSLLVEDLLDRVIFVVSRSRSIDSRGGRETEPDRRW